MKKILFLSLLVLFVFASASVYAAEKYALGAGNVALKIDYINFTDSAFDKIDLKGGVYVGLEAYTAIYPNLYLGLESGWAGTKNDDTISIGQFADVDVDLKTTFVPIELNLKYAIPLDPNWVIDLGGGVSYSYFKIKAEDIDASKDDWVFGGQVFADINYKLSKEWFIGINGKYQFTEDLKFDNFDTKTKADNWRVGANIGIMF